MVKIPDKWRDLVHSLIFIIYCVLIVMIVVGALTLGRGAELDFNLIKSNFYFLMLIFAMVGIVAGKFAQYLAKRSKTFDKKIGWFGSFIFDWEEGLLSKAKGFEWLSKFSHQLMFGILLFSV